jgi:hypothetical protein
MHPLMIRIIKKIMETAIKKITVVGQLFPHLNRKGVTGTWMVNISVVIRDGMLI